MNEKVPVEDWAAVVAGVREAGFRYFDWLDCVDEIGRSNEFRLVLQLLDRDTAETRRLETRTDRDTPRVPTLSEVFSGAGWAEREIHDLFGVEFLGGDGTPLLLPRRYGGHPLRKDEILAARAAVPWPGAKEPGEAQASAGRRRMAPPGVPDPEIWGDRDPAADPADPTEVVQSAQGGRVRRRR
ncbi:NADH-quinone oxidoreductase subunit C [Granulicoccus sp. GXG6511]|uniref:NADH-quinone oxidoreductase subunit C n=1 Tax=Granulicoccus sp. GXG6511 TaxID=3381351 RepID=UPI003D7F0AE7